MTENTRSQTKCTKQIRCSFSTLLWLGFLLRGRFSRPSGPHNKKGCAMQSTLKEVHEQLYLGNGYVCSCFWFGSHVLCSPRAPTISSGSVFRPPWHPPLSQLRNGGGPGAHGTSMVVPRPPTGYRLFLRELKNQVHLFAVTEADEAPQRPPEHI